MKTILNKVTDNSKLSELYEKIYKEAFRQKNKNILQYLIKNDKIELDQEKINKDINTYIEIICSGTGDIELIDILINKIENDVSLCCVLVNNVFSGIYEDNNKINDLLIYNFEKIIEIANKKPNSCADLFNPFEVIFKNNNNRFSGLVEIIINKISNDNNLIKDVFNLACNNNCLYIMDKLFENEKLRNYIVDEIIIKNKNCTNIINNIFNLAHKNNHLYFINELLKNKNINKNIIDNLINSKDSNNIFNLAYNNDYSNIVYIFLDKKKKLKKEIKHNNIDKLLFKAIKDKKIRIVKKLVKLGAKFKKDNIKHLINKNKKLNSSVINNLITMAKLNKENEKKILKIKIKEKEQIIDENDFKELNNALNLIVKNNPTISI